MSQDALPPPDSPEVDLEKILCEIDSYIVMFAYRVAPRSTSNPDEIAQEIRIRLWNSLQKRTIVNLPAYVRKIGHSAAVDAVRRSKPFLPLDFDEDGEIQHGDVMWSNNKGLQDPLLILEENETLRTLIKQIIEKVEALSSRQQQAMKGVLKEEVDDILSLIADTLTSPLSEIVARVDALSESVRLRDDVEQRLLRASRSIARRKLREEMEREQ